MLRGATARRGALVLALAVFLVPFGVPRVLDRASAPKTSRAGAGFAALCRDHGGTPTAAATALIHEIEGMPRDRYAGPVGWMDASGDGEWGIALRSAMVTDSGVRLFAGCGIVASSDPEAELAESQAKFVPVRDALEG